MDDPSLRDLGELGNAQALELSEPSRPVERRGPSARLLRFLENAERDAERSLRALLRERAASFAKAVCVFLQSSRSPAAGDTGLAQSIAALASNVQDLTTELGAVTLQSSGSKVYVNETLAIFGPNDRTPAELRTELARYGVASITFYGVPPETELRAFADPLDARGLRSVELGRIARDSDAADCVDRAWQRAAQGRPIDILSVRRAVSELLLLGRPIETQRALFDRQSPHVAHSLRVGCFALELGEAVGIAGSELQDLGIAALLHDIGYAQRASAECDATAALSSIAGHRLEGARMLAMQPGFHESKVRRVLGTLEHHRDYASPGARPSVFARIVRIADDFDNYSSARGGGLPDARALGAMAPHAGTRYDPVLFQLSVNLRLSPR